MTKARMYDAKWQPLLLILCEGDRLECQCGALATVVVGSIPDQADGSALSDVDVWCQPCFVRAQDKANKENNTHE